MQQRRIKTALWKQNETSWLLDNVQKEMVNAFEASTERKFIFLCSRRMGKSYLLSVLADRAARKRKCKIFYITAAYKDTKNIVQPLMAKVLADCPTALRPKFKAQDNKYVYPNGSEIFLIGVDKNPDGPRGQEGDLIILDEAGFINKLDYLVSSVLIPMLMMTNGRLLMATTPPKSTDHEFLGFLAEAETKGAVIKKTVYDCPRISPKMLAEYMDEAGGEDSPNWKREYLCEILQDEERSVFPEFDEAAQTAIIQATTPQPWADNYVGMDLGFTDFTAAIFAWWDFENARLVIEDELLVSRQNTAQIASAITKIEQRHWGDKKPYKRVADHNNPQLIYDLNSLHGVQFSPANKEAGKEPMINKVRLAIKSRQILINPRCQNLINHLKYCRWKDKNRATFDRSERFGHFDFADALILLWNSINKHHNPTPASYRPDIYHYPNGRPNQSHPLQVLTGRKVIKNRY